MRKLWLALVLVAACGSKKPQQQPPPTGSGSDTGSAAGSGTADDCPKHVDCMPPTDEPCPPPGLKERCPNTQITY